MAGGERGNSRQDLQDTNEPLQLSLGQWQWKTMSTPVVAHTSSMHDANGTESLPTDSTVAPWPLQNQLFSPGLGGSLAAKLGRGCSRKRPFWCWTPGSMWRPFTTRNECLMFKICTEDSTWTSPAACRCMVPQMCWLLNTVELRHVASCSKGLWKRRIHSIYSLFQTRLFNVRMCHKRVICTLNWIVRYRSHRQYDLFLWIRIVCTSQSRTRRVTKHTVYFVPHCSHIFQLPQPNS